jgi:reactive intermediate/imine deaminase
MREQLTGPDVPFADAPYSPGFKAGGFVFTPQVPLLPDGDLEIVNGDFDAQVRQCLENLGATMEAADGDLDDIIKVTVFLEDLDKYDKLNNVWTEYFNAPYPARNPVGVNEVPFGADIEIDAIGYVET